jgi:hypothetical protein
MGTPAYTLNTGDAHQPADLVAAELQPNTGNLGSSDDVDQIWWRLDEVPVDGFLGGERGAVGAAYDAGVVPATALVEPFEQLSDRLSGGAA